MTAYARMTWGLTLLTLLMLSVSFATISAILDRYQERQLDTALLAVAHAEAREAPANHFSFTGRPGPAANDVGPLDKYGVIFDEQGRVLAATQPFDVGTPGLHELKVVIDRPFDFSFAGGRYRAVGPRFLAFHVTSCCSPLRAKTWTAIVASSAKPWRLRWQRLRSAC